jgi:hypothetical protein
MAATMKQTCESTNNKTTQPIGGFLPFFISVSLGVCMGVPRLQRHKELGSKVGSTSDGRNGETISLVMG